jgi:four helix bundle protein
MTSHTSFRELKVWQESMLLVEDVYQITRHFPVEERYALTSQIRRAAISIPSNIGEGQRRKRRRAFLNHLDIALGSQGEVDVQLELGPRLGYCDRQLVVPVQRRLDGIGRMLNGLITSLQPPDDW